MTDDTTTPVEPRLDDTLHLVRHTLKRRTRRILAEQGIAGREWMLLRSLADGDAPRFAHPRLLRSLHERGWVSPGSDGPQLTEFGRGAVERTRTRLAELRAEAAASVSDDDLRVTLATLTAITERLGAELPDEDPAERPWRGPFGGHGFGHHRGFGRGHGFGRQHGFDDEHGGCGPHGRHGHRPFPFEGPNRHRGFGAAEGPTDGERDPRI